MRDTFLYRLESRVERRRLKLTAIRFLTACVSNQPGLIEMMLNLNKPQQNEDPNCLDIIMNILKDASKVIITETILETVKQSKPILL